MTRHDLVQSFFLYKKLCPIACRALVVCEEVFDGIVIERTHIVRFHECAQSNGRATRRQRPLAPADPAAAGLNGLKPNSMELISVSRTRAHHCFASYGAGEATSFWKRGSFRSGSNIGSSRSSAG